MLTTHPNKNSTAVIKTAPAIHFAASGMGRETNSACSIKQMPSAGAIEKSVCRGK